MSEMDSLRDEVARRKLEELRSDKVADRDFVQIARASLSGCQAESAILQSKAGNGKQAVASAANSGFPKDFQSNPAWLQNASGVFVKQNESSPRPY